jgi:DNA-binding response OmpR family regulator
MTNEPICILLVEDNPDHAELVMKALGRARLMNQIFWVKDGEECLHFLLHEGAYANGTNAPKPGLILLDIRLPKIDGLEVLRRIKANKDLHTVPVVMLTTSDLGEEVKEAYRLGANSYVTKPVRFSEFVEKVQAVELYWLLTNIPPKD